MKDHITITNHGQLITNTNYWELAVEEASFDLLPSEQPPGQEWICSTWDIKRGRPHKAVERVCYWRRVPQLPWLKKWEV